MKRTLIKNVLNTKPENQSIMIAGWVRTRRDSGGGFSFIELSDGSSQKTIQVIADNDLSNYESEIKHLSTGSSVAVTGELTESPGKGQSVEIKAKTVEVFSLADESYPLQKKRHSFEFLREIAHLRPRTNSLGAVMRVRSAASFAIHKFFTERDFFYIHTPIISASDAEGAGELFTVTALNPGARSAADYKNDFFGDRAFLTVSGQLQGEAYALALSNIYTFGPTFRAENSNTSRHLAEFWMIEPEMAFCDLDGDCELAEEFLKYIIAYILENRPDDMELFDKFVDKGIIARLQALVESGFERITYTDAIEVLKKAKQKFEFPVEWGHDLQSEHERYLTEKHFKKPAIVTDYPASIKAFYMKLNEDEKTVRAMDVLAPGIGEIIGGSERETRHDLLADRMEKSGIAPEDLWWYLDLRKFGSVPHAGFGLGLERLLQFVTGMQNIRDVIPFPRYPKHAKF